MLKDGDMRAKIAEAMAVDFRSDLEHDGLTAEQIETQINRSKERITSAPVAILLCLDSSELDSYPDTRSRGTGG